MTSEIPASCVRLAPPKKCPHVDTDNPTFVQKVYRFLAIKRQPARNIRKTAGQRGPVGERLDQLFFLPQRTQKDSGPQGTPISMRLYGPMR